MSTTHPRPRPAVDWRRSEFILTALGFCGFITLLIRIKMLWSNLPAHPLFVHVPVVLIPLSVVGGLAIVARPRWLDRFGELICVCAIVAMSSVFLAMQAGGAFENSLNLQGQAAHLISEHSAAAKVLAIAFTAFTAVLILTFFAHRISGGRPTQLVVADRVLGSKLTYLALRGVLVILAVMCAFYVYRVGDLGARAVWAGRLGPG